MVSQMASSVNLLYLCVYVCLSVYPLKEGCVYATTLMWRTEDNLKVLIFSFQSVGPRDQTETINSLALKSLPLWKMDMKYSCDALSLSPMALNGI